MAQSKGKEFEARFKQQFLASFPNSFILRLPDQVSGYKYTSSNICDFIGYAKGKLYLIECKSHLGASFPLSNLSQYNKLLPYVGIPGVRVGVVLWLIDKDKIFYVPISTVIQMKIKNKKSISYKDIDKWRIMEIPSIKKVVFMDSDYSVLDILEEGD